jgi:predicted lipoprotein with Yx(FWY)xxD motif
LPERGKFGIHVEYNGYPLDRYSGDRAPGETKGDGLNRDGGTWHVLTVSFV